MPEVSIHWHALVPWAVCNALQTDHIPLIWSNILWRHFIRHSWAIRTFIVPIKNHLQNNSLFKWAPTNFKVKSIHPVPLKALNGCIKWPDLAQPMTVWSGTTWGSVWNYVWKPVISSVCGTKMIHVSFKFNITKCYLLCQQGHFTFLVVTGQWL